MKIKALVHAVILLPVLFTIGGGFLMVPQVNRLSHAFDEVLAYEVPIADALAEMRVGATRIVASASEHGLLTDRSSALAQGQDHPAALEYNLAAAIEAGELVEDGEQRLRTALGTYTQLVAQARLRYVHDEHPLDSHLTRLTDEFIGAAREMLLARQRGASAADILALKQSFEATERNLLGLINAAHQRVEAHNRDHETQVRVVLQSLKTASLLVPSLLTLLLAGMGALLLYRFAVPITTLKDVVQRTRQGDRAAVEVLQVNRNDEIGLFNRALREFVEVQQSTNDALLRAKEQAEDAVRTKALLLTSLEALVESRTAELTETKEAAEAANLAKSRFLATMSHELRTPLNGILGLAQLLLEDQVDDLLRKDFARTIHNSGQALLVLLNDILDLSRVEAGKMELSKTIFSPKQLVEETTHLFFPLAQEKGLAIEALWLGEPDQHYLADASRLRQMVSNLINNAIKFTHRGSVRIEGRVVETHGQSALLEFAVSDSGIGLSRDQQSRLFQPFSQADSSTTRVYGGSGLGLSIISSLAQLMGGTVGVESKEGEGSRFWFRVLVDTPIEGVERRRKARDAGGQLSKPLEMGDNQVMVVEDNAVNRMVVELLLKKLGVAFVSYENGQQAFDALCSGATPCLVLMDMHMPVMDGLEATRRIRAWEQATARKPLTIVALTANAFPEDARLCRDAGMDEFLTKPISMEALRAALSQGGRTCQAAASS